MLISCFGLLRIASMLSIGFRVLLAVVVTIGSLVALGEPLPPDQDDPSGYVVPRDGSPLRMLNPFSSDWRVWLGPLLMGAAAWILIRALWPRPSDDEGRGTDPDEWP